MRLQNFSMAGAVALVGVGLIAHSAALVFSSLGNSAQAGVGAAAPAVASAAMAQGGGEPTIVWYGTIGRQQDGFLLRAWSDGKVEGRVVVGASSWGQTGWSCYLTSCSGWMIISTPSDGLTAFADLNSDSKVDAIDLAEVLSRWGDAPRNDIPPSDCPLNLVNP